MWWLWWVLIGWMSMLLLMVACMGVSSFVSDWRYARVTKIWLEVPPDIEGTMILPLLTRLSQRYQGTTTLVVFPEGCRGIESKRLTLALGFKPCGALLAVLRELGTVEVGC